MGRANWKELKAAKRAEDPEAYDAAFAEGDEAYKLGVLVRELRTAAGLSQTELARRAGTSQPAIARLEAGGSSPNLSSLRRIAAALDADLVVEFHSKAGAA